MDISPSADFGDTNHDDIQSSLSRLHGQLAIKGQHQCFANAKVTNIPDFGMVSIEISQKSPVFDWLDAQIKRGTFDGKVAHRVTQVIPERKEIFTMFVMSHETGKVTAAVDKTLDGLSIAKKAKADAAHTHGGAHPHDCYKYL